MMQPTPRDLADFREWADTADWVTAKRGAPHQYVVRGEQVDDELFLRLIKMVRRYGEPAKFYRHVFIYWIVDGHRYWTMGAPLGPTIILNRAPAGDLYGVQDAPHTASPVSSVYDTLAPDYDARYATPECEAQDAAVAGLLRDLCPDPVRVLDVGAGTGLLLDLHCLDLVSYTAVDPSQAMLNELIRKHPRVRRVIPARLEDCDLDGARFDLIAALFGAASYLTRDAIFWLPDLLAPAGRLLLMFYEDGYRPDYYIADPPVHDDSREAAIFLPNATVSTVGRFVVVAAR